MKKNTSCVNLGLISTHAIVVICYIIFRDSVCVCCVFSDMSNQDSHMHVKKNTSCFNLGLISNIIFVCDIMSNTYKFRRGQQLSQNIQGALLIWMHNVTNHDGLQMLHNVMLTITRFSSILGCVVCQTIVILSYWLHSTFNCLVCQTQCFSPSFCHIFLIIRVSMSCLIR